MATNHRGATQEDLHVTAKRRQTEINEIYAVIFATGRGGLIKLSKMQ